MHPEFTCTPHAIGGCGGGNSVGGSIVTPVVPIITGARNRSPTKKKPQQRQKQPRSEEIDDLFETHYFFNHIMAIQKRVSPGGGVPPSVLLSGGSQCLTQAFVNVSGLGHNTQTYTDITLRLHYRDYDNNTLQHEICAHRVILAACSDYFARMFQYAQQHEPASRVCDIYLTETMSNKDAQILLPQFFALFYQPVLDDTQFSIQQLEQIISQVLVLRTLATQFLFTALEQYLTHKLYERLDIQVFVAVFIYCLAPTVSPADEGTPPYQLVDERKDLFQRLIAWFVCCADVQEYHIPHLNRIIGMSGSIITTATSSSNTTNNHNDEHMDCETPPVATVVHTNMQRPALLPIYNDAGVVTRERNRKRKRLSTSNDAKIAIFDFMSRLVDRFDSHDMYSCRTRDSPLATGETEIRLFQRVCPQCIGDRKQVQITRANQTHRKWFFYLDLSLGHDETHQSTLHAKLAYNDNKVTNQLVSCQTTITLLSRLFENRAQTSQAPIVSSLEHFTPLLGFHLHDPSHCYLGECDVCHSHNRRIYVVRYDVLCKNVDK